MNYIKQVNCFKITTQVPVILYIAEMVFSKIKKLLEILIVKIIQQDDVRKVSKVTLLLQKIFFKKGCFFDFLVYTMFMKLKITLVILYEEYNN